MANIRILLVDDDEVVRLTLTSVLEQCGFVITTAACVPEALKYISSETYDVLLSDLHMPGAGDGLTVVSAIWCSRSNMMHIHAAHSSRR